MALMQGRDRMWTVVLSNCWDFVLLFTAKKYLLHVYNFLSNYLDIYSIDAKPRKSADSSIIQLLALYTIAYS